MTPSGWHDDARNRDAGHDEMQIAVYDWLKDLSDGANPFRPDSDYVRLVTHFEFPFLAKGKILAWGDVVEVWRMTTKDELGETHHKQRIIVLEIKPKIYGVGAVIRQCKALSYAVQSDYEDREPLKNLVCECSVWPVVMADDPKLAALRHVHFAAAWDRELRL